MNDFSEVNEVFTEINTTLAKAKVKREKHHLLEGDKELRFIKEFPAQVTNDQYLFVSSVLAEEGVSRTRLKQSTHKLLDLVKEIEKTKLPTQKSAFKNIEDIYK